MTQVDREHERPGGFYILHNNRDQAGETSRHLKWAVAVRHVSCLTIYGQFDVHADTLSDDPSPLRSSVANDTMELRERAFRAGLWTVSAYGLDLFARFVTTLVMTRLL